MDQPPTIGKSTSASDSEVAALIVGAGPTGLTMAAHLAPYTPDIRVIDDKPGPVHESRALAIQPRTLEVLAGLGVAETLVDEGNETVGVQIHSAGQTTSLPLFDIGLEDTLYPFILFLSQAETEAVLADHVESMGVHVERRTRLVALRNEPDGIYGTVRTEDGAREVTRARYVIGCDGAGSTVREQARIPFPGYAYPQTFLLADLEVDGLEPGFAHAYLGKQGILLFFPLVRPASWRMVATRSPEASPGADSPTDLHELQTIADRYANQSISLRDPVWMTAFRIHHRRARTYREGAVFLAGDAAHVHSPAGAQGMNTGIQDAANLAWKLGMVISGRAPVALLDAYPQEREPIGRNVLRFTDVASRAATSNGTITRFVRTRLAPKMLAYVSRVPRLRRAGFRVISQLGIEYPNSVLNAQRGTGMRGMPRPGERLPDARVLRQGQPTTLHRLLSPPGFHLFWLGPPTGEERSELEGLTHAHRPLLHLHVITHATGTGDLEDHEGEVRRHLRWDPSTSPDRHFLVRPDGYIAYSGADGRAGLERYLARWLNSADNHRGTA